MIRCYGVAKDSAVAEQEMRTALELDALAVVAIEWCVENDATEWENPDDPDAAACILSAKESRGVVYSEFHSWST